MSFQQVGGLVTKNVSVLCLYLVALYFKSIKNQLTFIKEFPYIHKGISLHSYYRFSIHNKIWIPWEIWICRSTRPEVFCRKSVLRNFAKFTGNHLRQSIFFNKFVGLGPATLLKKIPWHMCFPVNFATLQRTPFFTENFR